MKFFVNLYAILLLFAVVACSTRDEPRESEPITIKIQNLVLDYQEVSKGASAENLMAIQIYEVVDGGDLKAYANGLFSDWTELSFKGYSSTVYRVEATMIVNATERLSMLNGIYQKPFECATTTELMYSEEPLAGLSQSITTHSDGQEYSIAGTDRYYGSNSKEVTISDASILVTMKRVSFGVKLEGVTGETITLKLADAPAVNISSDEIEYFTFRNIVSAYNSDESTTPYSELIEVEILRNGEVVYNKEVSFQRNMLAVVTVEQGEISLGFDFEEPFEDDNSDTGGEIITPENATAYVTKVLDYRPAPGQFVNIMPEYIDGDTQADMNQKALESICHKGRGAITLRGYGGNVTVGFDHTIVNVEGECDFRVLGNAFYSLDAPNSLVYGSCEPAIIMVAYDVNKNGVPDSDEWYEIAGSAHNDVTNEQWYMSAKAKGNDVNFYDDFKITYTRPTSEPSEENYNTYIPWRDNKGGSGYIPKNMFNSNDYFPSWITEDLTFSGSRLPQNGVNQGDENAPYYALYKFDYGYADNAMDSEDDSAIDISWAIDSNGAKANLPGVDFIKIYSGVNQVNGWLGECSAEIAGVVDLHIL